MVLFVFALILVIAAFALFVVWRKQVKCYKDGEKDKYGDAPVRAPFAWSSFGALVLGLLLLFLSLITAVSTSALGIVTNFGQPVATLDNGLHLKAPWQDVTEIAGTVQTDSHTEGGGNCISVRLGNMSVACVDVTIKWQVKQEAALDLFKTYRSDDTFNNIRDSLVTRDLTSELNDQFSTFDPMASMNADTGAVDRDLIGNLATSTKTELVNQIGQWIDIQDVS